MYNKGCHFCFKKRLVKIEIERFMAISRNILEFFRRYDDERLVPWDVLDIYNKWADISKNPREWLQDLSGEIAFTAGGGLVTLLGEKESQVWQGVLKASENDIFKMAGIDFSVRGLSLMGDFYRHLKGNRYKFQCVDERLENIREAGHNGTEVHCECGACAAMHASIKNVTNIKDMEAHVQGELGQDKLEKQGIYDTMPNHSTISILADFHGDDSVVNEQKRAELRAINGLPFQASLPVKEVEAFIKEKNLKRAEIDLLLKTLVQWNVQIPRNIIGGDHNDLQNQAKHTLIVTDTRGIKGPRQRRIVRKMIKLINSSVQYSKRIDIK